MKRILLGTTSALLLSMASFAHANTTIELQRFFGSCDAKYGNQSDVSAAVGECGIITTLLNKFQAENPDIKVKDTVVEWPGYNQLNAQLVSNAAPDLVTMHYSAIPDYLSHHLLMPIDKILAKEGITKDDFTDPSIKGVSADGHMYGLPFDTWTMLFHVNLNLMKKAGLMNADGTPILPTSEKTFFEQAKKFKAATGKPYLVQILANEKASYARMFYTLLMQQNSDFFKDPSKIDITTPQAKAALSFMKRISDEDLTTKGMDYPAAVSGFTNGDGGIAVNGTWLIGSYDEQSHQKGNALSGDGYAVYPFPQIFSGRDASFVDGHSWVVPRGDRSEEKRAAIGRLLKFLYQNDYQWSRTGHLPAVKAVYKTAEFNALPFRSNLAEIPKIGHTLPKGVQRQFAVQDIIGDEVGAAVNGDKSIDDALETAQERINDMLDNL